MIGHVFSLLLPVQNNTPQFRFFEPLFCEDAAIDLLLLFCFVFLMQKPEIIQQPGGTVRLNSHVSHPPQPPPPTPPRAFDLCAIIPHCLRLRHSNTTYLCVYRFSDMSLAVSNPRAAGLESCGHPCGHNFHSCCPCPFPNLPSGVRFPLLPNHRYHIIPIDSYPFYNLIFRLLSMVSLSLI